MQMRVHRFFGFQNNNHCRTLEPRGSHGGAPEPLEYVPGEAGDEHEVKPEVGGRNFIYHRFVIALFSTSILDQFVITTFSHIRGLLYKMLRINS